jgi:hypothetical protein
MTGYLVFGWRWPPENPVAWLENHPAEQDQLKLENAR